MEGMIKVQGAFNQWEDDLLLFPVEGLLPSGQALSVNTTYLIVSLVLTNSTSENPILLQRLLTELQMRLLLPLLESPHYCPHEVLYTSLFYSYRGLLAGLFSSNGTSREEWQAAIERNRVFLQHTYKLGTRKKRVGTIL